MDGVSGLNQSSETIFAAATGGMPTAVAIVRISGPRSRFAVETIAGSCPAARRASYRPLRDPVEGTVIDRGLVLWFPGPDSFTGEDSAEFQVHGGRAVVDAVLAALSAIEGLRLAGPGEFTYRAFLNGRMDLTAVEGLADLIAAETEVQRRQALRQSDGMLGRVYRDWREVLIGLQARVEAVLDFAEEEDVADVDLVPVWARIDKLADAIRDHLEGARRGQAIRKGISVALMGVPNAGKSSLLNALARRDAAIVSQEAGTTRDVVTVAMNLGGYLFNFSDTAGLRAVESAVEAEGVRRAMARGGEADLVLWLSPADRPATTAPAEIGGATVVWPVRSKSDLGAGSASAPVDRSISVVSGAGLAELELALVGFAQGHCGSGVEDLASRTRHREALQGAVEALAEARRDDHAPLEVRAEHLRRAADALGRLTGRIDVEDLLDRIFAEFCVGK